MKFLKAAARSALVPLIYRYPPVGLAPERLQYFLRTIIETEAVPGAIVEVGCNLAGTSIVAHKMATRLNIRKSYYCLDTFDGFIPDQFDIDVGLGTPTKLSSMFSGNSTALVRKILNFHDCSDIKLVQKDCTKIEASDFGGEKISVCLFDVDLSDPIRRGLHKLWPLMSPGGVILVDDCPPNSDWKAKIGVDEFSRETGIPVEYKFGLGILSKPAV